MFIKETWVNETDGHQLGNSGVYEPFTNDIGELFKRLQKDYGRCISGMFIDSPDNNVKKIGWVFEKLEKYTDCNKFYKKHTWIEIIKNHAS